MFCYRIYNAISLNAVIFTTVCLASMLNAALSGFVLVSVSIHFFAFAPNINKVSDIHSALKIILMITNSVFHVH